MDSNIPNNEIWYTTIDKNYKAEDKNYSYTTFGAKKLSHKYESGKGIIEFDKDVTVIGDGAFTHYPMMDSITLPKTITSIGDWAFNGCISLKSITIPESVTSIGHHAFQGCASFDSVHIPSNVESIGENAFWLCDNLKCIYISQYTYEKIKSNIKNIVTEGTEVLVIIGNIDRNGNFFEFDKTTVGV